MFGLRDFGKSFRSNRKNRLISQATCTTKRSTPLPEGLLTLYCLRWIRSGSKVLPFLACTVNWSEG